MAKVFFKDEDFTEGKVKKEIIGHAEDVVFLNVNFDEDFVLKNCFNSITFFDCVGTIKGSITTENVTVHNSDIKYIGSIYQAQGYTLLDSRVEIDKGNFSAGILTKSTSSTLVKGKGANVAVNTMSRNNQ